MKIIGHRGTRGLCPENTIASILKAIDHDVDMVEFDVRVTKDGVAILHHDQAIVDPSGNELIIAHTTYAELLRHKPDLAALDHAIRAVQHHCPMMIEIKPGVPVKQTVAVIRDRLARGWRLNEFMIASFDYQLLRYVKRAFPKVTLVVIERWSGVRATSRARRLGTKYISMNQKWLWLGFLKLMKKKGYRLSAYTVNDPARAKKWKPYLYAIITDRPDLFKK
ncbi:glycerophosphodiester phosphodiesterase [Candidatus Saccharibacteria bacterium]|nr:MAG: glycerophosphodiester phosphodiesterase [Candidatus Saccharibacteria bacterium]